MLTVTAILLLIIALLHFYWALGYKWGLDKAIPTGIKGQRTLKPPKILTALVGIFLLGFAYVAYMLGQGNHHNIMVYMGWTIGVIFILRAIGEFNVVGIFKKIKGTVFAKYDTYFYIPLCLFVGYAFISHLLGLDV